MELIKRTFQYQQGCFVVGLLFTAILLPTVLPAVIGESPPPEEEDAGDPLPCTYHGHVIPHGGEYNVDSCTIVTCHNSAAIADIEVCPDILCPSPVELEGECCNFCPYYVPIYEINTGMLNNVTEREVNDIVFDLNLMINGVSGDASSVTGQGLWKLSVWGSGSNDGEGERVSYQEQVLTEEQAALTLTRPPYLKAFDFDISNIAYSLNGTGATCMEMEFLCYEFNKGDNPDLKDPRLDFAVEGVAGEHDSSQAPQNLRGCTRFSECVEDISVSENTVQACDNISGGQENDLVFDIRVAVRGADINGNGEESWNVNVLGVNVVTSGDND